MLIDQNVIAGTALDDIAAGGPAHVNGVVSFASNDGAVCRRIF